MSHAWCPSKSDVIIAIKSADGDLFVDSNSSKIKMGDVKLHGAWASPFCYRVIWGLKLKDIPYEYIEEDTSNKSDLLVKYNPVHKKIPVLVHGGKPICESIVILEYIESTWPNNALLPINPYDRAIARFWIKFVEDKGSVIWLVYWTTGEEQEKAIKESVEMLKSIEEQALAGIGIEGEKKFVGGGERIGMADVVLGSIAQWLRMIEEVVGVTIMKERSFPRWRAWMNNFNNAPIIKHNSPDFGEMVEFFAQRREMLLGMPRLR